MKKLISVICFLSILFVFVQSIGAQDSQTAAGFRGQSMNGTTGLFSIPSGRLGWEKPNTFAMDFGYRAVINNDLGIAHIPALTMSLFGWVEISTAFDFQPKIKYWDKSENNNDMLLNLKIRLPTNASTAIAIGTNFQFINIDNEDDHDYNAYQPYIAITYPGNFFKMPAETTIVFGKTFYSNYPYNNNSNIDFGMGFDIILFPDALKNLLHWVIDFSNFGYSDNAWPNAGFYTTNSVWRGILNTGFRIDLSSIPELSKYKFLIDIIFNDLFDEGSRSFTTGIVFGFSVK
ncbi:hypothetical protein [Treponema sp. R6D11]